jgi:hypothetical protein
MPEPQSRPAAFITIVVRERTEPMSEQTKVALTAEEIAKLIATEIKAYHQGRPNLRAKHLKLACEEFSEETINALWDDAEAKRPPPPTPKPSEVPLAPQIDAGLSVSGKPPWVRIGRGTTIEAKAIKVKSVAVREVQGKALAVPVGFAPMTAGELTLNPATPFDTAQKLISLRAWQPDEGVRTWRHWQGSFWQWTGQRWKEIEDETVRAFLWYQLNDADKIVKGGRRERFEPKPEHVNALTDALKAATNCPTKGNPMPGWFGE